MDLPRNVQKIAFLSDYIPRKCGIATFTADLRQAIAAQYPGLQSSIIAMTDRPAGYDYPPEVRFEIPEQDISAYRRAADFLNLINVDVLCLQHEFGIFGGPNGRHLLTLLRNLRMPVVTTLHTILRDPTREQKLVLQEVINLSARVVSMAEKGIEFLREIYETPVDKIDLIPHGIPDVPFTDPNYYKDKFGAEGRPVLLTFGLLSPNKGIEHVLNALPAVVQRFSQRRVYRARCDPSQSRTGPRRDLSAQPRAPCQEKWCRKERDFLQPLRGQGRVAGVSRSGRHLYHAVSEQDSNHERHAGLQFRRRQGGHFHTVLARGGIACRWARNACSLCRCPRDRASGL